ncbi:hypothetical protein C7271_16935 [filamentous cyanobacterium CCP5]|nr:hypothetical protein C7271_16935 [filamentous cyanobacterium CCP5]
MSFRRSQLSPCLKGFLGTLGLTAAVWCLRGVGLLTFLPGIVIWILILACFSLGIISSLQKMR